jgi:tetratricopeptide (TPR) repeat protein
MATPWLSISAQEPAATQPANNPQEAAVIESLVTKVEFENNGTGVRLTKGRIRVQSDAGAQQWGVLVTQYQQANESVEIKSVSVHKAGGTVIVTPPENIQDMPADVTRVAPFYSDLREKQVAVKGLGSGDTLEYEILIRVHTPLIPGQFWLNYDFVDDGIALAEELEVSFPSQRQVKVKSLKVEPAISEEGNRRVYRWKTANLESKTQDKETPATSKTEVPPFDVQISTFQSWEEVGRWYAGLQQDRVQPSPEIRAKALELTRDAGDDEAKIRQIYSYVATKFRYIGIAFGIGRYQPHSAGEILDNQYGDCKDKHTLLASLLQALGVKAYPALINSSRKIDTDVPSPGQFDHVITAIPRGPGFIWLDTTTEIAPFGFLTYNLRDKQALVMPEDQPPRPMKTPAEIPVPSIVKFKINAELSDAGTLEGKIERSARGDAEVMLRAAFRRIPQSKWKDLVQTISYASGFGGSVDNVTASVPEETDEPFRFAYNYTRKDYPDWANKRLTMPCPFFGLPAPKEQEEGKGAQEPLEMGPPIEVQYEGEVKLPQGYSPQLPEPANLEEDFAEYHSTYAAEDGAIVAHRRLVIKVHEIPPERLEAYRKFRDAANEDERRFIELTSESAAAEPAKLDPEATRLFMEVGQAIQRRDVRAAIDLLKQVLDVDPDYPRAWVGLGAAYMMTGEVDKGLEALRKEVDLHPSDPFSYKSLGYALMSLRRTEEAIPVWRELRKIDPQDRDAPANLGGALVDLGRYDEAVKELEVAADLNPTSAQIQAELGHAYLYAGNSDKAAAAYEKAVEAEPSANLLNTIAYTLADKNEQLPTALRFAERATIAQEKKTEDLRLDRLQTSDLSAIDLLGMIWDTLGWVYFRQGELEQAEKYVHAGWSLQQHPIQADHLGQIYERQQKKQAAIRAYAWALAGSETMAKSRECLLRLAGNKARAEAAIQDARSELSAIRTVKLKPIMSKQATAEFFVLLSPGPKVEEVKFISGDEGLRKATEALAAAKYDVLFPNDHPIRIVRRGILMCHSGATGCEFVLYPTDSVRSVN